MRFFSVKGRLLRVCLSGVVVLFLFLFLVNIDYTGREPRLVIPAEAASAGLCQTPQQQQQQPQHSAQALSASDPIPANTSMKVKLIVLTYMRSGSTLTADVFNQHPKVFYVFEPLWSLQKLTLNPIYFMNKPTRIPKPDKFYEAKSLSTQYLQSFLGCDLGGLDPRTLTQYHMRHSRSTVDYYACTLGKPGVVGILQCLALLVTPCRRADVTVVKTIRFTMAQAAGLLESDPTVKVVHLIRDPRGTLRSQARVGEGLLDKATAATFCQRVLADLRLAETLKHLHQGRVLTARYEDIATEPLRFAQELLDFAGLGPMSQRLRHYLWNITSAGLPDNCVICTTRNNSRQTALKWRSHLTLSDVADVDAVCGAVYSRLGYLPLATREQLLDVGRVPAFLESSKVPGLWGGGVRVRSGEGKGEKNLALET